MAALLAAALLPVATALIDGTDDPLAAIQIFGSAALIFGALAASLQTLRLRFGLTWLLRLRNPAAGIGFAYAATHAFLAFQADAGLRWNDRVRDAIESPALLAGYAAMLLALPLALTANRVAIRILGARVWQDVQESLGLVVFLAALHGLALAEDSRYFAATLTAAAAIVWVAFAKARDLRDQLRQPQPTEPVDGVQQLRFYRKRPK